jgi:hypothetical protein
MNRLATAEEMRKEVRAAEEIVTRAEATLERTRKYLTRQKEALRLAENRERLERGNVCGATWRGHTCIREFEHGIRHDGWAHHDTQTMWAADAS